jgi:hypothetical protein
MKSINLAQTIAQTKDIDSKPKTLVRNKAKNFALNRFYTKIGNLIQPWV